MQDMTTDLGCIGMAVQDVDELLDLVASLADDAVLRGRSSSGQEVFSWVDASGASLTLYGSDADGLVDLVAGYAGEPTTALSGVTRLGQLLAVADLVDEDGETLTRMGCQVPQAQFLPEQPVSGVAVVTALGLDVSVHDSAAAFVASPASLLVRGAGRRGKRFRG